MNRSWFNQFTAAVVAEIESGNSGDVEYEQQEVRQDSSIPGNERCRSENDNGRRANNAREKRTYWRNRNRRDNYIGHQQSTSSSSGNSNARYDGQQAANMDNVERLYCPLSDKNKTFLSLNKTCSWRDSSKNLVSHLLSTHLDNFSEQSHIVIGPQLHTEFFFTRAFEKVFMVILKYHQDTNKYCIYVFANLPEVECGYFLYNVCIISFRRGIRSERKYQIMPLCDILKNKSHVGCFEMHIDTMKKMFEGDTSFNLFVDIEKKKEREIKAFESKLTAGSVSNTTSKDQAPSIDEGILRELECPICNDFMVPPIYICQAGHSVCNSCNKKIVTCPICRNTMLNARNYMLEKLTGHVNYPCKNRSIGCFYVSSSEKIRNHERNCFLTEKNCILVYCAWKGTTLEMVKHLSEDHTVSKLNEVNQVVVGPLKEFTIEAVIHDNQVFRFTLSYGFNIPFQYNLQHLGSDSIQYKYELQILDKSGNDLNLILRHLCPILEVNPEKKDKKCEQKYGFSLAYEFIQPLVSETTELDYKLNISKVVTK